MTKIPRPRIQVNIQVNLYTTGSARCNVDQYVVWLQFLTLTITPRDVIIPCVFDGCRILYYICTGKEANVTVIWFAARWICDLRGYRLDSSRWRITAWDIHKYCNHILNIFFTFVYAWLTYPFHSVTCRYVPMTIFPLNTRGWHTVGWMLAGVADAGPALNQHCVNVSCLLGYQLCPWT